MTEQSEPSGVTTAGEMPVPDAASGRTAIDVDAPASEQLRELAAALGVDTEFRDRRGVQTGVEPATILAVLAEFGFQPESEDDVAAALTEVRLRPWRRVLPEIVVLAQGNRSSLDVHVDSVLLKDGAPGAEVKVWFEPEQGEAVALLRDGQEPATQEVDGRTVSRLVFELPDDLPLGWHQLRVSVAASVSGLDAADPAGDQAGVEVVDQADAEAGVAADADADADAAAGPLEAAAPLVVTPARLELPEQVTRERAWGFTTQLYAVRSAQSWGFGDLADLREIVGWSAREHGAGFVLVNPLHAAEPIPPMESSPHLPTTRRFFNPIYLRVEDIREVAYLPATERAIVEWQAEALQALNSDPADLDRDAVWTAKSAVLQMLFARPRSRERQADFEAFCVREGQGLADFAMWNALAEQYGLPTEHWPAFALNPRGEAVEHLHFELADRVQFHMWLQWCLDEQLAGIARLARLAGMPIGLIHDLAAGVHPDGADAWSLEPVLAGGVSIGSAPDEVDERGQDSFQTPWRPDQLSALGYAPYRDMLRTLLRHAGALRVEHIAGLFRQWWVPIGKSPAEGTYVRYDHEAMIGILALEAQRAGAFVVGDDAGLAPSEADYLRGRGILGTSVLWFELDAEGKPLAPEHWRELCLATVTTDDLPPAAGYLAGEHVELREKLGLLRRPLAEEAALETAQREALLAQLGQLGLLGAEPTERDKVEAVQQFLTLTPARLVGVALADAVGDRRAVNQPGTYTEYPNWRLPLADGVGQPMLLEDVLSAIRVTSLAASVQARLHPAAAT